jgi:hypothetical protein
MFRVLCNERKIPRQFIVAFYDGAAGPVMVEGPFRSRAPAQRAARRIAKLGRYRRSRR